MLKRIIDEPAGYCSRRFTTSSRPGLSLKHLGTPRRSGPQCWPPVVPVDLRLFSGSLFLACHMTSSSQSDAPDEPEHLETEIVDCKEGGGVWVEDGRGLSRPQVNFKRH